MSACSPPLSGFLTGLVNGVTGSQVMPVLPYLLNLSLDKDTFVQAINISFTLSSLVMLAGLFRLGLLDATQLGTGAIGILPASAGIWLGGKLRRRLSEATFRRLVLLVLLVLGAGLILR